MNREEAFEELKSEAVEKRLDAARYFALNAKSEDLPRLRAALNVESVRWIKIALRRAIDTAEARTPLRTAIPTAPSDPSAETLRDLMSEAVEEVAGTILHEFAGVVGIIRVQAKLEIPNYDQSQTKKMVDMLSALMRGVRGLKTAASVPVFAEFDLATVVAEAVSTIDEKHQQLISVAGAMPFFVTLDRERLLLAVGNGLRNAVEAVQDNPQARPAAVVINWGRAGAEDWLAIIDNGPGFPGNPAAALPLGITNKKDHIGFGLATAQQAMRAMEGDVYLTNGIEGGARFELRWFRTHANSVR